MKKILKTLFISVFFCLIFTNTSQAYQCGETFRARLGEDVSNMCNCSNVNNKPDFIGNVLSEIYYCCGSYSSIEGQCYANKDPNIYACGESRMRASVPQGGVCDCPGGQWQSYNYVVNRVCCGWLNPEKTQCLSAPPQVNEVYCGTEYDPDAQNAKKCVCSNQEAIPNRSTGNTRCCGWYRDGQCQNTDVGINDVEVSAATLESLNPFKIGGSSVDLSNPGKIISRALQFFIFPIAGIILFVVMLLGGFQMLSGANNSKSLDEGKQKITSAIIGFIILFAAYWIAQLLEIIFGIRILS